MSKMMDAEVPDLDETDNKYELMCVCLHEVPTMWLAD